MLLMQQHQAGPLPATNSKIGMKTSINQSINQSALQLHDKLGRASATQKDGGCHMQPVQSACDCQVVGT